MRKNSRRISAGRSSSSSRIRSSRRSRWSSRSTSITSCASPMDEIVGRRSLRPAVTKVPDRPTQGPYPHRLRSSEPGLVRSPRCGKERAMERIVVGVDGSEISRAALQWAVDEARRRTATVEAIHVLHQPFVYGYAYLAEVETDDYAEEAQKVLN